MSIARPAQAAALCAPTWAGTFKNLGSKWRNATMRNNASRAIDENRLVVSYTLALL